VSGHTVSVNLNQPEVCYCLHETPPTGSLLLFT